MLMIEKTELKKNFETHLRNFAALTEPPGFMDMSINLEVTHTFAESNDGGTTRLLEKIFFNPNKNHRGLLSYGYREKHKLPNSRKPATYAKKFGLNDFVFAYPGSHEPYYAGKDIEPSFGVFISKELEKTDTANASRRDLASSEIIKPVRKEFLTPEDARTLIACEISTKYNGDIWYYWGSPLYFNEAGYFRKMWERKAEMHFYDSVPPKYIRGIIWPDKKYHIHGGINSSSQIKEMQGFAQLYPDIKIYNYKWTAKYGQEAFVNASCYVSKYYYENQKYPESCTIDYEP
jgi:hypothetical protein